MYFFTGSGVYMWYTWFWKLGILHLILWCSPGQKQMFASCIWEKKYTYSIWYKNVQVWCMRMGPNNLAAPWSFLHLEAVSRGCQYQIAQLSAADAAASMSHLQGHKLYIDDTGTRWFMGLKNFVGVFLFVCFCQSFVVVVTDFPASTFSVYYVSF